MKSAWAKRIAIWDAINKVVEASGGSVSAVRQEAVVEACGCMS